jgi:hypothetical protein
MSSKLPVELLRMILENVEYRADLATICYVSKIFCVCSQDILYRDIYVEGYSGLPVCDTLAQSIHLAERVRSFSVDLPGEEDYLETIAKVLQNMSSLRNLKLDFGSIYSSILDGCTFKLDSFSCLFNDSESLRNFLYSQPGLTRINLAGLVGFDDSHVFDATFLPNLTRISAASHWLPYLIRGRPVSEVHAFLSWREPSINWSIFALSTVPIEKLHIPYSYIYGEHVPHLASIFPSLEHLTISNEGSPVRVPFSSL